MDSPLGPSISLVEHLEALLAILAPAAERIRERALTDGWTCSFYCSIFGAATLPRGELVAVPAAVLSGISALGVSLEFVFYGAEG